MHRLQTIKHALLTYYRVPLEVPFRQFRAGLIYFGVGFGMVIMAGQYMQPSIQQEVAVLAGLALGGIGFILAMLAQVRLLLSRIVQFFSPDKVQDGKVH